MEQLAKVITDEHGVTHLRHGTAGATLCGAETPSGTVSDGTLTCPDCAELALVAVELVTKAEKRLWRQL